MNLKIRILILHDVGETPHLSLSNGKSISKLQSHDNILSGLE